MSLKRELDSQAGAYQTSRPKKKHRVYTDEDAKLAKIYDNLASELRNVQLDAAVDLLSSYKSSGAPEKIIVRLIRGLCSSRKAARPGFFIALTEVFKSVRTAGDNPALLKKSLALITEFTEAERGASKSEKKEHVLGRLAGYSSLIHSQVIFDEYDGSESDEYTSSLFEPFLQGLLSISSKAPHLSDQVGKLLVDIVVHAAAIPAPSHVEVLLKYLQQSDMLHTPNGLAVWMATLESTPKITFPVGVWKKNNPFGNDEIHRVSKALSNDYKIEETGGDDVGGESKSKNHGIARREPHFVWKAVLNTLVKIERGSSGKGDVIKEFWHLAIDAPYFAPECSPERKALGFRIFALALITLPDDLIPGILSPQLLRCLVNQHADAGRYLHYIANDTVQKLMQRITADDHPTVLRYVILALTRNKNQSQDKQARIARTNHLVNQLVKAASPSSVIGTIPIYETMIKEALMLNGKSGSNQTTDLTVFALQLNIMFRTTLREESTESHGALMAIIRLLRIGAYDMDIPSANRVKEVTVNGRKPFQIQLWSCIKDMLERLKPDDILSLDDAKVINCAVTPESSKTAADSFQAELLKEAQATCETLLRDLGDDDSSEPIQARKCALFILYSLAQLQVRFEKPDAAASLGDLLESFREYKEDSEDFHDIVDVILAMLSKPDSVFRLAAEIVFSAFAPVIPAHGLAALFHVLSREENIAGQRDIFDQQSEEDDEDASSSESASDVEVVSAGEDVDDGTESSSGEEDGSDNPDEEEEDDEVEEEEGEQNSGDEALNATLGEILRTRNGDAESAADSDSDSDMTDGAMEELNIDAQLSTIFKQRAQSAAGTAARPSKKATQLEAKRVIVTFKSRILGLLNAFIATQYARADCLAVILPLCQLVGSTRNAQLARSADSALERYTKLAKKKHGLPVGVDAEVAWGMLAELHVEALLFRSKAHANVCSRGALFLARVLVEKARIEAKKDGKAVARVVKRLKKQYETARERKEELGSQLPDSFWEQWSTWLTSMALN